MSGAYRSKATQTVYWMMWHACWDAHAPVCMVILYKHSLDPVFTQIQTVSAMLAKKANLILHFGFYTLQSAW